MASTKNEQNLEKKEKKVEDTAEKPVCTVSTTAEHARADNDDEPCDDGREGQ